MEIILSLLFAVMLVAVLLYITAKRLDKAQQKNRQLAQQNKAQKQELINAKKSKQINEANAHLSADELDNRLQQHGYYRD